MRNIPEQSWKILHNKAHKSYANYFLSQPFNNNSHLSRYIDYSLPFLSKPLTIKKTIMKFKLGLFVTAALLCNCVISQVPNNQRTLPTTAQVTQVQSPPINGLTYKIKNVASGRYAQTGNASRANGATIHLYDNRNEAHFIWKVIVVKDGFKFQNVNSNKFLGVAASSKDVNGILCQVDDSGQPNVEWSLVKRGAGFKLKNKKSGLLMGVEGGSRNNEAKLVQGIEDAAADRVWQFENIIQQSDQPALQSQTIGQKVLVDIILNYIAISETTRNRIDNNDCRRLFGTITTEVWELDANNEMKTKLGSYNNMQQFVYLQKNYNNPPPIGLAFYEDKIVLSENNEMGKVTYNIPVSLLQQKRIMLVIKTNVGTRHKDNDFATYDYLKMETEKQSTIILETNAGSRDLIPGKEGFIMVNTDPASSNRNFHIQDIVIPFAVFQRTDDTHNIWLKISCKKK